MTENIRHSMTAAEEEAWVRGGGRMPSNAGKVYVPPVPTLVLTEPLAAALAEELAAVRPLVTRARARRLPPIRQEPIRREYKQDTASATHHPVATRAEHGTLRAYLAGCHCLDCTNAANEAAMLGEYKP